MRPKIQKWRVRISFFFGILVFILVAISSSRWETHCMYVTSVLFAFGLVFVGLASLGRLWCSLYIAGYKTTELVTEGPYSICRNPLYFFSFVGFLGVGLCSETLLIPLILLGAFSIYYPAVIKREEARLRSVHSGAYDDYFASTPRFVPKFSLLKEPDTYVVNPKIFRKHMIEALGFIWCVGGLELIEEAHELGWLPNLFQIF